MTTVFRVAADLHLGPATPGLNALFLELLAGLRARAASGATPPALYLLGDIFEYWAGDDDLDAPFNAGLTGALRDTTRSGVDIGFLPGNRDFLVGPRFAERTGVRLLADPFILSLPSWQFALTHGDAFCTDDLPYQQFRATVRDNAWQRQFLSLPLAERKRQIEAIRLRSEAGKRDAAARAPDAMDVNRGAVEDFLHDHGYPTLIHGHTHRPDRHDHIVDGIHCERWVLADWRETDAEGRAYGETLDWDGESLRRTPLGSTSRITEI